MSSHKGTAKGKGKTKEWSNKEMMKIEVEINELENKNSRTSIPTKLQLNFFLYFNFSHRD